MGFLQSTNLSLSVSSIEGIEILGRIRQLAEPEINGQKLITS